MRNKKLLLFLTTTKAKISQITHRIIKCPITNLSPCQIHDFYVSSDDPIELFTSHRYHRNYHKSVNPIGIGNFEFLLKIHESLRLLLVTTKKNCGLLAHTNWRIF